MATSTTATGLKMVSMEPPKFNPPVTASPPLMLFCRSEEQRAKSTATPTPEPLLALSKAKTDKNGNGWHQITHFSEANGTFSSGVVRPLAAAIARLLLLSARPPAVHTERPTRRRSSRWQTTFPQQRSQRSRHRKSPPASAEYPGPIQSKLGDCAHWDPVNA